MGEVTREDQMSGDDIFKAQMNSADSAEALLSLALEWPDICGNDPYYRDFSRVFWDNAERLTNHG